MSKFLYWAAVVESDGTVLVISTHDSASMAMAAAKRFHETGHNYVEVRVQEHPTRSILWSSLDEAERADKTAVKPYVLSFSPTSRGFSRATFVDMYGSECSIQESSLATERAIWLGVDKPFDKDVLGERCTRMHLTREMVGALLPGLVKFVYTGELPDE